MEVKKVAWRRGYHAAIDAETAYTAIDTIKEQNGGVLTPEIVVIKAKGKRHALHKCFNWDDEKAAHEYRVHQARNLINAVEVIYHETPHVQSRAYQVVTQAAKGGQSERKIYATTEEALTDPNKRIEVLMRANNEAKAFRRRYHYLSELANVIHAIDEFTESDFLKEANSI